VSATRGSSLLQLGRLEVLNFFASTDNATRWLASHPDVHGAVSSIDDAIVAGQTAFSDILEEG